MSMGFSRAHAVRALTTNKNNVEAAVDWALNTPEEETAIFNATAASSATTTTATAVETSAYRDGPGKYRLVALISHIGNRPSSGHYVAHIRKDDRWVIFNDEVVALSEHPPKDLAYLYIYKRLTN